MKRNLIYILILLSTLVSCSSKGVTTSFESTLLECESSNNQVIESEAVLEKETQVISEVESEKETTKESEVEKSTFEVKKFANKSITLDYYLFIPRKTLINENTSLIVYLHGGSGKGSDLNLITDNDGFPKYLKEGSIGDVNSYVIIPQLASKYKGWNDISSTLNALITSTINTYNITSNKIRLTGHSMGGTGTYQVAITLSGVFDKIAPCSGSVTLNDSNVETLSKVKLWAFVGDSDTIVKPESTINFVSALEEKNADCKVTILEGAGHFDVPSLAYNTTSGLLDWLMD